MLFASETQIKIPVSDENPKKKKWEYGKKRRTYLQNSLEEMDCEGWSHQPTSEIIIWEEPKGRKTEEKSRSIQEKHAYCAGDFDWWSPELTFHSLEYWRWIPNISRNPNKDSIRKVVMDMAVMKGEEGYRKAWSLICTMAIILINLQAIAMWVCALRAEEGYIS